MKNMKIGVCFTPCERTPNLEMISIELANHVCNLIKKSGYKSEVYQYLPEHNSAPICDVYFNMVYGYVGFGMKDEFQADSARNMELRKFFLVGADSTALALVQDKLECGKKLERAGILVPKIFKDQGIARLCLIEKPRYGACHSEITMIKSGTPISKKENFIVQEFICGREFTVGVIEIDGIPKAFTPLEIIFDNKDPLNSYLGQSSPQKYIHREDNPHELKQIAQKAFKILGLRDYARFDFRVNEKGEVYLLDANGLPNLHPSVSFLPKLASYDGLNYKELIVAILESAIFRLKSKSQIDRRSSTCF